MDTAQMKKDIIEIFTLADKDKISIDKAYDKFYTNNESYNTLDEDKKAEIKLGFTRIVKMYYHQLTAAFIGNDYEQFNDIIENNEVGYREKI